jgi:hypothetical protein
MSFQSNVCSESSTSDNPVSEQQPDAMQEMHKLIDEFLASQLDTTEKIVDDHLSMDEERREAEILQHRTLLRLSAPVAPSGSTIRRRPVGAPPRLAASVNVSHDALPPSRIAEPVVASPAVSHGRGRTNSVVQASPYRNIRFTRQSDRAHEAPISVQDDRDQDVPMLMTELQSDSAQDAPILVPELLPKYVSREPTPIITPHYNRITTQEDRRHSLPAGDLISYNGDINTYELQPLPEDAKPPLVVTTRLWSSQLSSPSTTQLW